MMGILDLIYPKICLGCGKWGKYVCERCQLGMMEEEQLCPGCGMVSRFGLGHRDCRNKGNLAGLTCFWAHEGVVKKMIEEVKYEGYFDCMGELVQLSLELTTREEFQYFLRFLENRPMAVPVPLFKKREKKRGFNQADLVARAFATRHKLSLNSHLLVRVKDTGQQVGRTRKERLEAMNEAFRVNPNIEYLISKQASNFKAQLPQTVLLVDDVWTTGATMQECARVLKEGGIAEVWGLVLAR